MYTQHRKNKYFITDIKYCVALFIPHSSLEPSEPVKRMDKIDMISLFFFLVIYHLRHCLEFQTVYKSSQFQTVDNMNTTQRMQWNSMNV